MWVNVLCTLLYLIFFLNVFKKRDEVDCDCGISRNIEHSENQTTTIYPWLVIIFNYKRGIEDISKCSGTIISSRYVVTAAHCVTTDVGGKVVVDKLDEIRIAVGNPKYPKTWPWKGLEVTEVIVHEDYKMLESDADVALLEISQSERLDLNIYSPACISQTSDTLRFDWDFSVAEAFSHMITGHEIVVETIPIKISSQHLCERYLSGYFRAEVLSPDTAFICGQSFGYSNNIIKGDSGGPLMMQENDQHILYGIISKGMNRREGTQFQLYERVSDYRVWLDRKMTNPEFCPSGPNIGVIRSKDMLKEDEKDSYIPKLCETVTFCSAILYLLFIFDIKAKVQVDPPDAQEEEMLHVVVVEQSFSL